jgi:hypothetical protein
MYWANPGGTLSGSSTSSISYLVPSSFYGGTNPGVAGGGPVEIQGATLSTQALFANQLEAQPQVFFDNANRSNGAIGSNYITAGNTVNISSNQFVGTSAGAHSFAIWAPIATPTPPYNPQFCRISVAAVTAGNDVGCLLVFNSGSNGYYCMETNTTLYIQRITAGGFQGLQTTAVTSAAGDTLTGIYNPNTNPNLTCTSTSIAGVATTVTGNDTNFTTGSPGIGISSNSAANAAGDNFEGGYLHPVAQIDSELDWTSPQHFPAITVGATAPIAGTLTNGSITAATYLTQSNCNVNGASPAACGSAVAGAVVVPTTTATYTVNTTAVTTNSRIFILPITDATGLSGSPTCVAPPTPFIGYVSGRSAGTSFTFALPSTTGTSCWEFWIVN